MSEILHFKTGTLFVRYCVNQIKLALLVPSVVGFPRIVMLVNIRVSCTRLLLS